MAEFVGTTSTVIHGGFFQLTSRANADGKIVKAEGRDRVALELRQFRFAQASAPPTAPFLGLRTPRAGAAERSVVINGVQGWELLTGSTNGLDIATRGPTDRRHIYFRENLQTAASTPLRVSQHILWCVIGKDWNIKRLACGQ